MSMITCPDCGKAISNQSDACCYCGRPLDDVRQKVIRICGTGEIVLEQEHLTKTQAAEYIDRATNRKYYHYSYIYESGSEYRMIPDDDTIETVKDLRRVIGIGPTGAVCEARRLTPQEAQLYIDELYDDKLQMISALKAQHADYFSLQLRRWYAVDNDLPTNDPSIFQLALATQDQEQKHLINDITPKIQKAKSTIIKSSLIAVIPAILSIVCLCIVPKAPGEGFLLYAFLCAGMAAAIIGLSTYPAYKDRKTYQSLLDEVTNDFVGYKRRRFSFEQPEPEYRYTATTQPSPQPATTTPKCPTCGSTNVARISTTKRIIGVELVGLASSNIGKTMECKNCGYKW